MEKKTEEKIQDIHRRKYLANIRLLPDLRQKKTREYLQVIFTFAALIFASIFAINPTLTTIAELNRQLDDAKQVDAALKTKVGNLSSLYNQYAALHDDLPYINNAIPQDEQAQLILAEIQAIATHDNLQLSTLSVNNQQVSSTTPTQSNQLLISLNTSGRYQDMRQFINDIIHFQRIVTLDSIEISQGKIGGVQLTLSGKAYFLP